MGFEIPEPFKWDKSFEVFYQSLDEEHKGLFDAIFNLAKSPSDGCALATLAKLIDTHFHNEEAMMKKANYDDFESHHNAHTDFVATLKTVTTPVNDAQLHWAKDWLVNHIKGTDFKYKGKL